MGVGGAGAHPPFIGTRGEVIESAHRASSHFWPHSDPFCELNLVGDGPGSGPVALGAVHNATGSWTVPLIVLIAALGAQVAAGVQASRPRHVLAGRKWS